MTNDSPLMHLQHAWDRMHALSHQPGGETFDSSLLQENAERQFHDFLLDWENGDSVPYFGQVIDMVQTLLSEVLIDCHDKAIRNNRIYLVKQFCHLVETKGMCVKLGFSH